jgi:predicted secreted Zn-dependent protease
MQLSEILHDSDYRQSQFDLVQIHEFERNFFFIFVTRMNKAKAMTEKEIEYGILIN